jgi:hypothetical protein
MISSDKLTLDDDGEFYKLDDEDLAKPEDPIEDEDEGDDDTIIDIPEVTLDETDDVEIIDIPEEILVEAAADEDNEEA